MASARLFNDEARIRKRNAIDTYTGRYALDTPGNGVDLPFNADPHIRIQHWGGNFCTNMLDIDSDLRGMTRPLNFRDYLENSQHKQFSVTPKPLNSNPKITNYVTDESRVTCPAWVHREQELDRWNGTLGATRLGADGTLDPTQNNPIDLKFLNKPFYENLNTRILEKDYFKPKWTKSGGFSEPTPYNK